MNKVAFSTTIFPMDESYLHEFFKSLCNQTYKYFDLIILNDGFEGLDKFKRDYEGLNFIEIIYRGTPAQNREYAIKYIVKSGYDVVVFGDSDDYFSPNRVEKTIQLLEENDVVVNELCIFNESKIIQKGYISNRFKSNQRITLEDIKDKNIFGLSNTAAKVNLLVDLEINEDLVAVDWYIYSRVLLNGFEAVYTDEVITYYRQYEGNTIGLGHLNADFYLRSLKVKELHYQQLSVLNELYTKLLNETKLRLKQCSQNNNFNLSNDNSNNLLWWELPRVTGDE